MRCGLAARHAAEVARPGRGYGRVGKLRAPSGASLTEAVVAATAIGRPVGLELISFFRVVPFLMRTEWGQTRKNCECGCDERMRSSQVDAHADAEPSEDEEGRRRREAQPAGREATGGGGGGRSRAKDRSFRRLPTDWFVYLRCRKSAG